MLFFYYLRKYWSEALLSIAMLGILWLLIFYWCPSYLRGLFIFHNQHADLSKEAEGFGRGTFGDMYGALNTFLSGLAFLGAVTAILLQVFQINRDKRKFEDEIKVQLNLFKWHIQRLSTIYLPDLKKRLEIQRGKKTIEMFRMNFTDDYSFRELEKINLLDLYKGFVLLDKNFQADELISFFQQLKEVYDDYKNIEKFIRENEKELKELENRMNLLKGNLIEKLIALDRTDLAKNVQSLGSDYQFTEVNENGETVLDPLLNRVLEHSEYVDAIGTFSYHELIFESSKDAQITRINSILILCSTLLKSIPSIQSF